MQNSTIDTVKALVQQNGGWGFVLGHYSCFQEALTKAKSSQGQVACPFGNAGKTKFRFITKGGAFEMTGASYHEDHEYLDGISLIEMAERTTTKEALKIIANICGGFDVATDAMVKTYQTQASEAKVLTEAEVEERNQWLNRVAVDCVPASQSDVVERYLRNRGLKGDMALLPNCLFSNPSLFHKDTSENVTFWPGLVASVSDENYDVVSLHRHYITKDGKKAPVDNAKKMMTPNVINMNGGSIKLDLPLELEGHGLLGVCEGLETALAIREATGIPMWSGIDANKMKSMKIPAWVTTVIIWGDHDRSKTGDEKSEELKTRLENEVPGRNVIIHIPDTIEIPHKSKSVDWLDVYNHLGAEYFPVFIHDENLAVKTGVAVPQMQEEGEVA